MGIGESWCGKGDIKGSQKKSGSLSDKPTPGQNKLHT